MKKYFAYILVMILGLVSCDDNTGTLGGSIIPEQDVIAIDTATYWATSKSIAVDSVIGKSSKIYLGRFTDPQTNSMLEADFIAQFNCEEGEEKVFPDSIVGGCATKVELRLYFTTAFGDQANTMTAEVYQLEHTLLENERYYTNIEPEQFYNPDCAPIATKVYTATDYTQEDSKLNDPEYYPNINITLPTEFGTEFIQKYRNNPEYFDNASAFIEHVCKGFYVKAAKGDGTVLYIDQVSLDIYFEYFVSEDSSSVVSKSFTSTEEVLQTNRFHTEEEALASLVEDNSCTYLKTPAGIFTEVTLPIDSILANNDTINSAKISFECYNDTSDTEYKFGIPQTLLMVHKDDMHSFFEKNKLTDEISSFYAPYNSTYNRYEYDNIARLITYCNSKREESDDWNKVVLIPVTTITDSNNRIVNFRHDFDLNSVRLVGGKDQIKIRVITSKFD